ncbi:hypothetical protein CCHL11_02564 [Colletotrichum chlorophyti]|uniref:Uncharacterized protein n=1 Tax=Colletotrichum chlorophyti TaxID=708187 RepID=A0A1Q8S998_9PEZI|nr:hypothetical protein CCHL11_02564 [Colletotrichum chlorophyti]
MKQKDAPGTQNHNNKHPLIRLPYWYTFYNTQILLFVSGAYPMLHEKMTTYLGTGYEAQILNVIWVGLLSVEALMVAGVAVLSISRKLKAPPKQKTT